MYADFCYRISGIVIKSPLAFPYLPTTSDPPDAEISYGSVSPHLEEAKSRGVSYQAAPKRLLISVPEAGRYLVDQGQTITIDRASDSSEEVVRSYLLGAAFGGLLHQRGYLVLHGGAILVDRQAVVIAGDSGTGKSTLITALSQQGYPVMADDLAAIQIKDNQPLLHSSVPYVKLWVDSCKKLGLNHQELKSVRSDVDKKIVVLQDTSSQSQPVGISKIFILRNSTDPTISITKLDGSVKLNALIRHTYCLNFIFGLGLTESNFSQCVSLGRIDNVYLVTRPLSPFLLTELLDQIKQYLYL